jgi:hypothetical protein
MLELEAYFELVQVLSAIYAAVILGAVNFAIAAILFAVAARPPKARELGLATEIHGTSVAAARSARAAIGAVRMPALLVPLITIIIKSLKKPAASVSAPAEPAASQSERWART